MQLGSSSHLHVDSRDEEYTAAAAMSALTRAHYLSPYWFTRLTMDFVRTWSLENILECVRNHPDRKEYETVLLLAHQS